MVNGIVCVLVRPLWIIVKCIVMLILMHYFVEALPEKEKQKEKLNDENRWKDMQQFFPHVNNIFTFLPSSVRWMFRRWDFIFLNNKVVLVFVFLVRMNVQRSPGRKELPCLDLDRLLMQSCSVMQACLPCCHGNIWKTSTGCVRSLTIEHFITAFCRHVRRSANICVVFSLARLTSCFAVKLWEFCFELLDCCFCCCCLDCLLLRTHKNKS